MVSEGIQNKKRETTLFRTCFKNETHTHKILYNLQNWFTVSSMFDV